MLIIENNCHDTAYNFSVEEFFTRYLRKEIPVLMIWQTDKTVMLGNNQVVNDEVDINLANNAGIKIIRRSSGGGAIYTDMGTVLYTVIQPLLSEAKTHKEEVAASIIAALNKMGIPAVREGRNDILLNNRKISGFAQYTSGKHICTHGSLLFDTDLELLSDVLIVNEEKLFPKGITSIRSRVTNIKPFLGGCSVNEFINLLKNTLLSGRDVSAYVLSDDEQDEINKIKNEKYANDEWNLRM